MPRLKLSRRMGPVGTALLLWDVYRRLPPAQRRWLRTQVRKHGPRVVKQANAVRKALR